MSGPHLSASFLLGSIQCPRGALQASTANPRQCAAFLLENPSAS
jgi:hypothetical protein